MSRHIWIVITYNHYTNKPKKNENVHFTSNSVANDISEKQKIATKCNFSDFAVLRFDLDQFDSIFEYLKVTIFPGFSQ